MGCNVTKAFITCPIEKKETLGIKLPFLVMIIKNVTFPLTQLKKYFTFEVQVLDDKNVRRRFRASNYQSTTRVKPFICTMPMRLDEGTWKWNVGWNQIQFNLSDFTRRAYGSNYIETLRVSIHANCRIRRIYFSDRLYSEEELPPEFKLFLPIQKQQWERLSYFVAVLTFYLLNPSYHPFDSLSLSLPSFFNFNTILNSHWPQICFFYIFLIYERHFSRRPHQIR